LVIAGLLGAAPLGESEREIVLRARVVLVRGAAVPIDRYARALRHPEPTFVEHAEIILGRDISLRRGCTKPRDGARPILHEAVALRIEDAEIVLRHGVAGLGAGEVEGSPRDRVGGHGRRGWQLLRLWRWKRFGLRRR
jgi:hypothetical protein